jgi:hypothetical protein
MIQSFLPLSLIFMGNIFIISRITVANWQRKGQLHAAGGQGGGNKRGKVSLFSCTF